MPNTRFYAKTAKSPLCRAAILGPTPKTRIVELIQREPVPRTGTNTGKEKRKFSFEGEKQHKTCLYATRPDHCRIRNSKKHKNRASITIHSFCSTPAFAYGESE
jgi:hypothetical protein